MYAINRNYSVCWKSSETTKTVRSSMHVMLLTGRKKRSPWFETHTVIWSRYEICVTEIRQCLRGGRRASSSYCPYSLYSPMPNTCSTCEHGLNCHEEPQLTRAHALRPLRRLCVFNSLSLVRALMVTIRTISCYKSKICFSRNATSISITCFTHHSPSNERVKNCIKFDVILTVHLR